jgi:hydrogenase-4 component F
MGIIAIGLGLGGPLGLFGALLHIFNHSVGKSLLFFCAGNIRENLGTLRMDSISGMARTLPRTSIALVVGSLAIVGLPPFSLFVSEFAILSEAFSQARYTVAVLFLVVLSVVFGGFAYYLLHMLCGDASSKAPATGKIHASEYGVMGVAGACLLYFGVRIPHIFTVVVQDAMAVLR